jgi:hypothetical protein
MFTSKKLNWLDNALYMQGPGIKHWSSHLSTLKLEFLARLPDQKKIQNVKCVSNKCFMNHVQQNNVSTNKMFLLKHLIFTFNFQIAFKTNFLKNNNS